MRKSTYSTSSASSSRSWLRWAGIVVIFGSFVALLWYATSNRDNLMKSEDDLELVLPSAGPVKMRAENPGGMEVGNRDKQVFNLLDSGSIESEIEKEELCASEDSATLCNKKLPKVTALAADPKEAKAMAKQEREKSKNTDIALLIENYEVAEPKKAKAELKSKETLDEAKEPTVAKAAENVKEEVASNIVAPKGVKPIQPTKPVKLNKEKAEPKLELAPKKELFTGGAWGVQLASYRKLSGADKGAEIFLKKYPEILKPLTYVTEKIDIKDKGTFYRVQFIGLKDKQAAKEACSILKNKGADGCWYVSR